MALGDNAYSRLISAAKVILPIIALGILSLLFVVSRPGREGEPPRFVDLDLEELAKDEHLARPDYRSVTETGSILQLEAVELRPVPGQDSAYSGTQLSGKIDRTDGVSYTMTSNSGRLDEIAGVAWMTGDVVMTIVLRTAVRGDDMRMLYDVAHTILPNHAMTDVVVTA